MSMHTDTNDLRATCRDLLEPLVAQTVGIDSAAVVTSDGFELASVLRAGVSAEGTTGELVASSCCRARRAASVC